mmetsp:Transcript_34655/g.78370  ORF Transcript_34655/g.78370 Transcript_34655/m.78370 type:complete len:303 (+) Transcript_34655:328-1236(+)
MPIPAAAPPGVCHSSGLHASGYPGHHAHCHNMLSWRGLQQLVVLPVQCRPGAERRNDRMLDVCLRVVYASQFVHLCDAFLREEFISGLVEPYTEHLSSFGSHRIWHSIRLLVSATPKQVQHVGESCRCRPDSFWHAHLFSQLSDLEQGCQLLCSNSTPLRYGLVPLISPGIRLPFGRAPASSSDGGNLLPEHGNRDDPGLRNLQGRSAVCSSERSALLWVSGDRHTTPFSADCLEAEHDLCSKIGATAKSAALVLPAVDKRGGRDPLGQDGHRPAGLPHWGTGRLPGRRQHRVRVMAEGGNL